MPKPPWPRNSSIRYALPLTWLLIAVPTRIRCTTDLTTTRIRGQLPHLTPARPLLASVVAARGLQPEPVATDALVHLLSSSSASCAAVKKLAQDLCGGAEFGSLSFSGQVVAGADDGRPDMIGADILGNRVVIEAKFDAELTPLQLGDSYLNRLPAGQPGVLIFLAPGDRLHTLWPSLLTIHGDLPLLSTLGSGIVADEAEMRQELADGRVISAVSWKRLLDTLRAAIEKAADSEALADLPQIEGLVDWRSRTGWTPLVPGDLSERSGRQIDALRTSIVQAAMRATAQTARNGTGDTGPGRWITSAGGHKYWAGIWFHGWSRHGLSPVWVTVRASSHATMQVIEKALVPVMEEGLRRTFRRPPRSWDIPLLVPPGAELERVTEMLTVQLQRIGELLDSIPAPVTAEVIDEFADADLDADD